jgi:hypothetical protein
VTPEFQTAYTVIPNSVITRLLELGSLSALKVYLALSRRCYGNHRECWPKIETLEEETGLSRRSVFNALGELEGIHLITRETQYGEDGRQYATVYQLESPTVGVQPVARGEGAAGCTGEGAAHCTPSSMKNTKKRIKQCSLALSAPFTDEMIASEPFQEAWSTWIAYLKEKRKNPPPTTVVYQLRKLAKVSVSDAIQAIHDSIAGGYQGLFPEKVAANRPKSVRSRSQELLEGLDE